MRWLRCALPRGTAPTICARRGFARVSLDDSLASPPPDRRALSNVFTIDHIAEWYARPAPSTDGAAFGPLVRALGSAQTAVIMGVSSRAVELARLLLAPSSFLGTHLAGDTRGALATCNVRTVTMVGPAGPIQACPEGSRVTALLSHPDIGFRQTTDPFAHLLPKRGYLTKLARKPIRSLCLALRHPYKSHQKAAECPTHVIFEWLREPTDFILGSNTDVDGRRTAVAAQFQIQKFGRLSTPGGNLDSPVVPTPDVVEHAADLFFVETSTAGPIKDLDDPGFPVPPPPSDS